MVAVAHTYSAVLSRLAPLREAYTYSGNAAWYARCPVCCDRNRGHLRLWVTPEGDLRAKCYGGRCGAVPRRQWWQQLLACLQVAPYDFFAEPRRPRSGRKPMADRPKPIALYDYTDAKGRLLYQCCKYPEGWPQKCSYRRPATDLDDPARITTDAAGRWVWDGQGLDPDRLAVGEMVPVQHVLYRLPELVAADARHPVLIPEGEPDVEVLRSLGFTATTNPHGAGNWPEYLGSELTGRRVVVIEDNDLAGRKHSGWVAGHLLGCGVSSLRLVRFREFPERTDLTDWLRTRFEELPPSSALAPVWVAQQEPKFQAKIRRSVAELCRSAPEWGVLTAAEQGARRNPPPEGPPQRLEEALEDQQRAA